MRTIGAIMCGLSLLRGLMSEVLGESEPWPETSLSDCDAVNRHDLNAFLDCFDSGYRSEQPVHPDWAFTGREQVRQNWTAVFDGVPDIRAELLRSAEAGDARWAEWYWQGNRIDGTRLEMRGVTIFGIQHDRIMWGRLYMAGDLTRC
jgi:SnoaL-like domain